MFFNLFFCNILFIPLIYGSNNTSVKPELSNKTTKHLIFSSAEDKPQSTLLKTDKLNGKKMPDLSVEGGSLLPDIPITLSKVNDIGKSDQKSGVVARKGAFLTEDPVKSKETYNILANNSTELNKISNKDNKTVSDVNIHVMNHTIARLPMDKANYSIKNSNTVKAIVKTEIHKPLILSYDELAKSKPSSETLVNQLPTQNRSSKVVASANSQPGMIMPIVITILLVPMFAVLGYMALKRGQEAWKNRHYKRMDFLLDGMYND